MAAFHVRNESQRSVPEFLILLAVLVLGAAVQSQASESSAGEVSLHVTRGGKLVRAGAEERERAALLDRAAVLLHRLRGERAVADEQPRQSEAPRQRPGQGHAGARGQPSQHHRRVRPRGDDLAESQRRDLRGLREIGLQGSDEDPRAQGSGGEATQDGPADSGDNSVGGTDEDSGDPDAPGSPKEDANDGDADGGVQVADDSDEGTVDADPMATKVLSDIKTKEQEVQRLQAQLKEKQKNKNKADPEGDPSDPNGADSDADRSPAEVEAALSRPADDSQQPEEGGPPPSAEESPPEAGGSPDEAQPQSPAQAEDGGPQGSNLPADEQAIGSATFAQDAKKRKTAPAEEESVPAAVGEGPDAPAAQDPSREMPRAGASLGTPSEVRSSPALSEQARLAPDSGIKVVEKLREQYALMTNTLKAAQQEEQSLHNSFVSRVGDRSSSAFSALAAAGIVAFLLVASLALQRQTPGDPEHLEDPTLPSLARLPKHASIQALSLAWTFLSAAQCVMVVPDAYGLPQSPECNLFPSRLLLAGSVLLIMVSALGARRLMKPWTQAWNRTVVLGFIAGQLGVALLYGAASDPSDPMRLGADLRAFALAVSRLGLGVCVSFANVCLMMAVKVTPPESMVQFSLYRAGVMCVGAGVGALLASASIVWVCVPWVLLGGCAFMLLPEDLGLMLAKLAATEDAQHALKGSTKGEKPDDETIVLASRKTLWLVAAGATLVRAMLTASFETLATAIFVADFLFQAPDVLLAAGSSLACGAFVAPLLVIAKQAGDSADVSKISTLAAVCAAAAAALFFRPLPQLFASETAGLWLAFSASALALPAVHVMCGVLEGVALQQAVSEGPFNQENLITVNVVLQDCVSRVFAPPAMAFLFTAGGRSLCALALLALAGAAIAGSLSAGRALAALDQGGAGGQAAETAGKGSESAA